MALVMGFNLLMGFIIDTYDAPWKWEDDLVDNKIEITGQFAYDNKEGESSFTSETQQLQKEPYTDITKRSTNIFKLFAKGIRTPLYKFTTDTQMEQIVLNSLIFFWGIIHSLLILELYMFLINRKTS